MRKHEEIRTRRIVLKEPIQDAPLLRDYKRGATMMTTNAQIQLSGIVSRYENYSTDRGSSRLAVNSISRCPAVVKMILTHRGCVNYYSYFTTRDEMCIYRSAQLMRCRRRRSKTRAPCE